VLSLPLEDAIKSGTMMRTVALKAPHQFAFWAAASIMTVVARVEAKTTIRDKEEAKEVAREIWRQFPTLRIEEMQDVFDGIIFGRFGKYYERLKAAEFIDAFKQHEASEARIRCFETAHKVERYDVLIRSTIQWQAVFNHLEKHGYTLRADKCKDMKLHECYINIEGKVFDIDVKPHSEVVMKAKQFLKPVQYNFTPGADTTGRANTTKLSSALRKELTVEPRVMAEYMNKPSA
jgi:hypothetical protein